MSALCRHFGICGGCTLQDLPPDDYRAAKQAQISRALDRHGLGAVPVETPADIPARTRRRATLKALKHCGVVSVGFRAARSHRVVDMEECRVLTGALVNLVTALRGLLRMLLREGEDAELSLTEADNGFDIGLRMKRGADAFAIAELAGWAERNGAARLSINNEIAVQLVAPALRLAGSDLELPIGTFLQPSREGERILQDAVCQALHGATSVADLFAGCGTFTLALASSARVHAVDCDGSALSALRDAAHRTKNLKPVTVERRDLFRQPLEKRELDRYQAVVLDPPRAGALAQVAAFAHSRIARVAYVSCNPESFARDAQILVERGLDLRRVLPVDQFLWSSHIELVALFERR